MDLSGRLALGLLMGVIIGFVMFKGVVIPPVKTLSNGSGYNPYNIGSNPYY